MIRTEYPLCRSASGLHRPSAKLCAYCRYRTLSGKISAGWYAASTTPRSPAASTSSATKIQCLRSPRAAGLSLPVAPLQPVHRSTVTASTGPVGGASRYCQYRSASNLSGSAICRWPVRIAALPSARTHHSVSQSSE